MTLTFAINPEKTGILVGDGRKVLFAVWKRSGNVTGNWHLSWPVDNWRVIPMDEALVYLREWGILDHDD